MRNTLSFLLTGLCMISMASVTIQGSDFSGQCATSPTLYSAPYAQDFDGSGVLPPDWTGTMVVAASHGSEFSNGLTFNLFDHPSSTNCYAEAPDIFLTSSPCRLMFDYRIVNWENYPDSATTLHSGDETEVQVSYDNGNTFLTIYTIDQFTHVTSNDFATISLDFSIAAGSAKVRFLSTWGSGDYYIDIDNFIVEEIPLCSPPVELVVSGITPTSAMIGWSGAPFVEIDYGILNHIAGTGTLISAGSNNPQMISPLTAGLTYDIFVRQDCGSGIYSAWIGPVTFTTPDFLSVTPDPFDFGPVNIGISSPPQVFTISNNGTVGITIDSLVIEGADGEQFILSDGSSYPKSVNPGESYMVTVVFSPSSTGFKVAFIDIYQPGEDVIAVLIAGTGNCEMPSGLMASNFSIASADLGWVSNGPSAWEIEWGLSGFTQSTGTVITAVVSNPYTLFGLASGTSYDYYVRAHCMGGVFSPWAGPVSFTTSCVPDSIPYEQNFDGVIPPAIPSCWSKYSSEAERPWKTSATILAHSAPNSVMVSYISDAPKNEWLVSPAIQVVPGTDYRVRFWVKAPGYLGIPEKLKLVMSTDPSLAALIAAPVLWDGNNLLLSAYTEFAAPFTPVTAGPYYFAWHAYSAANIDFIALDDITFEVVPPCVTPTTLSAANITSTSAELNWAEAGTATTWDLEYGAPGFTVGTGTRISGIDAKPYLLAGLTASTNYVFMVRADCGLGNYSAWSAAFPFTTEPLVPVTLTVTGHVGSGQTPCYNATNTITVAGGPTTFTVAAGGSTTFIAGMKILFLPGTTVALNGYMLGKIAQAGPFCSPTKVGESASGGEVVSLSAERSFFSLYPNPTNGNFTLVQKGEQLYGIVKVEMYGMNGEKMISASMTGEKEHVFKTADLPPGLYFVRVIAGNYLETIKLVKTR